ncbi:MAG: hypothetical protein ACFB8W_19160 [Elainellaceae cyanobacterium]
MRASLSQFKQGVSEVSGTCAKVWGNIYVPSKGSIVISLEKDLLFATTESGFERGNTWVRVQNIDSVELSEAPIYALIALGIVLVLTGLGWLFGGLPFMGFVVLALGIACIVYAFTHKRRLLLIHSLRSTIALFLKGDPEYYHQFSIQILAMARHLNSRTVTVPATPQHTGKPSTSAAK